MLRGKRARRGARVALLAFLACGAIGVVGAGGAQADGRFGDSTWVAPPVAFDSDATTDGPRVAPRDHERRWETVLRTPFRVVFLPLRLVAGGLEAGVNYAGPRYFDPKPPSPPKAGPALAPYLSVGGLGDIGVGPGVTWIGFPVEGATLRLAGSWSMVDHRRVHFSETVGDRRPLGFRLRADYEYKPNHHYYGIGNGTPDSALSYFLLANTNAEGALLFGASPLRQIRLIGGYSSMSPGRGYHGSPLLEDVFAPVDAPYDRLTTQELWYGVAADLARLDDARDPSRGIHGRIDLRHVLGVRSTDPDYRQWRAEGRAYLPIFSERRVIAVRGVYAGVDPDGGASTILPFYRLAASDGATRFAGYASERFHDRELMLARIEYRWMIFYRMSAIGLYELGEVAPNSTAFTLRDSHRSYGGGLRFAMSETKVVRLELAKSTEGLHAVLSLGGDF